MAERIRIQYTVDVGELPREVGRLMEDAFNQYQLLQTACRHTSVESVMSHATVERLDSIRMELAAIDHRLHDAMNIIQGYLDYKGREVAATPEPASLEERLAAFEEAHTVMETHEVSD